MRSCHRWWVIIVGLVLWGCSQPPGVPQVVPDAGSPDGGEHVGVIVPPRGTFASAGATESAVVEHSQVHGVLIRATWAELEQMPGVFNFSRIDNQLTLVKAAGKGWSLAVVGGPSSPAWLYAPPYSVSSLDILFRGVTTKTPRFWDSTLQQRLGLLVDALAQRYGGDDSLELVYVTQMSANGIEGHFNGNTPAALTSQGFTEDLWVEAVLQAARKFASAFPNKPIAIELHDILGSSSAGQRIMNTLAASQALLEQIGVACWWLSGKTDYQAGLLAAFQTFPGRLYGQVIDQASNTASFPNGDYSQVFVQARALNMRYVEPWEVDFKSGKWDTVLAEFNQWAAAPP